MKPSLALLFLLAMESVGVGQFRLREVDGKSLEISDNGVPVFVYNFGTMLKAGVPEDRARCCYVHPVYAPDGTAVSDDFPKDHYHHRGIHWMWPNVTVDGKTYDLWLLKGIQPRFVKWEKKEAGADSATIAVENGWFVGERKVMRENVEMVAHRLRDGRRDIEFTLRFEAVDSDVEISGTTEGNKGYGGFNLRFAPRTGTVIDTAEGRDVADSDRVVHQWAELSGDFGGHRAGVRITIDSANPGYPNPWCLRHYGYLGANYPGLDKRVLRKGAALVQKYRVTVFSAASSAPAKKVLVYTRNGKGYVHDNIQASVEAIRKMGAENGFAVDVTTDSNFFTDATLAQYKAVIFSNTNNEAFDTAGQREAFQRYLQAGGGFVGIHSATGSERAWPYYWSIVGGKFWRHPKLQPFTVRVVDASHPSTSGLPATFQWEDECYMHEYLNPSLHPLLVTDPTALEDPDRAKRGLDLLGHAMPLAWTLNMDGGREFYTALGHKIEHYKDPLLVKHILGGILWAVGEGK